ncbi:MAG TPA: hypothetical protein VFP84_39975 [Kofleriaceae bacterium]|nr:hypothetical protein [Kofleriaceae bacterium]
MRVECEACGHVNVIGEPPAPAPEARAPDDDALACPKCGAARRPGATACGTCGLATARMAAYRDARDVAADPAVRDAWQRATEAWHDEARHEAVFQLAAAHNAYAWVARGYRARGKDPIAARQLARLLRAAEATLLAGATARPDKASAPYRAATGVLVALVIVIAAGLVYAVVVRDRRQDLRAHAPAAAPAPGPATGAPAVLVPGHPVSSSTIHP